MDLTIGLSSWIIQDGNYGEFTHADRASFAVEFWSQEPLNPCGPASRSAALLSSAGAAKQSTLRADHMTTWVDLQDALKKGDIGGLAPLLLAAICQANNDAPANLRTGAVFKGTVDLKPTLDRINAGKNTRIGMTGPSTATILVYRQGSFQAARAARLVQQDRPASAGGNML